MSFKINLFLSVFCLLLLGCSFTTNELKIAEQLIESKPDSALKILQNINPQNLESDSNRALYGLLMFQALDKSNKPLQPDSVISFALNYYQKSNDKQRLPICYFYKGRIYKSAQRYDDATELYLKALESSKDSKNYTMLGRIYADMGDIYVFQQDTKEALKKYQLSAYCFTRAGKPIDANYRILEIGRTYRLAKNYKVAHKYYHRALAQNNDSVLHGVVLQEMGINYYCAKQYDSALYYLHQSLHFPYKTTNYAVRCYILADLLFNLEQYDSAHYYALNALKYPASYFTQRDCYCILVNVEYLRKDIKQMSKYMTQYQCYSDSAGKVESQTKIKVLESLHKTAQEAKGAKRNISFIISALMIILFLSAFIVYFLYRRNKLKKSQLGSFKQQLNLKQEFVSQGLIKKVDDAKALQADERKNATPEEKIKLYKGLYNSVLHLNDWDAFKQEMNHAFNQIVDRLESEYTGITKKEIIWCCLQLLDIPTVDRMLLLDATSDSLYKLKQRLAHKMILKSTKELDAMLKRLATV
jgi:tetratricopeptide (TPR) repeat protein